MLDDGKELSVDDLEACKRALGALRKSKPGIVIDTEKMPALQSLKKRGMEDWFGYDAAPNRPSSWLPGGDTQWMTPLELADFEKSGGRASFSGATFPGENDRLFTVEF